MNTKLKSIIILSAAVSAVLITNACSELQNLYKPPEARIVSIDLVKVNFTSLSLNANLEITNPNPVGISLSAYDYSLRMFDNTLLQGRIEEPVSLKAEGTSVIPIPFEIQYSDIASIGAAFHTGEKSVPVDLDLGLEIAFPYMGGIRLDASGSVDIPILHIPKIEPLSITVDRVSLSGADISLSVNVENPNGYPLTINTAEGRLIISDNEWGNIGIDKEVNIPPMKNAVLKIKLHVSFSELGRSAWSLITGSSKADIRIEGDMDIDMNIPSFAGGGIPWTSSAKVSILR